MAVSEVQTKQAAALSDEEIVDRVLAGEPELFEILLRRYNQRLFHVTWSVLRNETEAEDAMQEAYVSAYANLHQFARKAKFSTWLTRIALYEAFSRSRKNGKLIYFHDPKEIEENMDQSTQQNNPERKLLKKEINTVLEGAIQNLPQEYRVVFVLRNIDGYSTAETAELLDMSEEAVKSRLFRANRILRKDIRASFGDASSTLLPFLGTRCDHLVERVMDRILNRQRVW